MAHAIVAGSDEEFAESGGYPWQVGAHGPRWLRVMAGFIRQGERELLLEVRFWGLVTRACTLNAAAKASCEEADSLLTRMEVLINQAKNISNRDLLTLLMAQINASEHRADLLDRRAEWQGTMSLQCGERARAAAAALANTFVRRTRQREKPDQ
jgi:hypothetical protein